MDAARSLHQCPTAPSEAHCFHYSAAEMQRIPGKDLFIEQVCCYCGLVLQRQLVATHELRAHGPHHPETAAAHA